MFHSDHTDNENYNQVLRANEDRDEGGDRDGRKLDNKDDDASGDDIGDGDDVDTGNGIGFKDTGDGVSVSNTRDLGANYAITETANTSFWHAQGAANAYNGREPDIEVMGAEYAQLTNQRVHIQTDLDALTQEQKNIVFNPINLVKVKWNGCVEGQFCMDGQPQVQCESHNRVNMFQKQLASIAAKERLHIVTDGVAGAYLNAEMAIDEI